MEGIKDSEEVMFKKAEFLANKLIELFTDMNPTLPDEIMPLNKRGKIEGVMCYLVYSKGVIRLNSEIIEANKLRLALIQDVMKMEAFIKLNILTGMKDFRGRE